MKPSVVRAARPSDADDLYALLVQFAQSYTPERAAFDRHLPLLLADDGVEPRVAELGGRVIGYALAFRLLTLYANGAILEIQELMVDPAHRGRGIGQRLVEALAEGARTAGCVELTVPTRRAAEYYRKLGFVETALYFKRKVDAPQQPRDPV
jgi:GNAT superfamily N-acetyltransferase